MKLPSADARVSGVAGPDSERRYESSDLSARTLAQPLFNDREAGNGSDRLLVPWLRLATLTMSCSWRAMINGQRLERAICQVRHSG